MGGARRTEMMPMVAALLRTEYRFLPSSTSTSIVNHTLPG